MAVEVPANMDELAPFEAFRQLPHLETSYGIYDLMIRTKVGSLHPVLTKHLLNYQLGIHIYPQFPDVKLFG